MPRLHKYRERNACYVLTAIRGAVITYQLTPDGERKLTAAGIAPGAQFQRALLLDLYRTGDAFTHDSTDVKHQAARRWVAAVNHWGQLGQWDFLPCRNPKNLSSELTKLHNPNRV